MKIKLGNHLVFELERHNIFWYIVGMLQMIIVLYIDKYLSFWYIFIISWTILFIWIETTYYPNGLEEKV
jgi:hypothetical protein